MNHCKLCESEKVSRHLENEIISYKGNDLNIPVEFSVCENCGREFLTKEQIQRNDAVLRDAKKAADGLLTSIEIYNARVKLGLTQDQAAIVFGGGRNAFSKYERAEVSQSVSMDRLIRVCLRHPNVFHELLAVSGIRRQRYEFDYEDNVVSYSDYKAANEDKFSPTRSKSVVMRDLEYGQVAN